MDPAVAIAPFQIVVIGASAGGLHALEALLAALPSRFPLPIVIVQHLDPHHESLLVSILGRHTALRVKTAAPGDRPESGTVYVAPPAHHLLIATDGTLELSTAAPVHWVRPSIDRLFATAADHFGRVIGIVLSGMGTDGASGAEAISRRAGVVIVEAAAAFAGMPQATIDAGVANFVVPLADIPPLLVRLAAGEQE